MNRPHVAARIAEMRQEAFRDGQMGMSERRAILADTARRTVRAAPSHGDRIAAIREDAILAGERRTDGTQLTIGGDLNLTLVLQSLRGSGDVLTRVEPVVDLVSEVVSLAAPTPGLQGTESGKASISRSAKERSDEKPEGAARLPISGPLGRVRSSGATLPLPEPPRAVQATGRASLTPAAYVCDE